MGVEAAAADHVAARAGHLRPAEAGEQGPGEQEGGPDRRAQLGVDLTGVDVPRPERHDVLVAPLHARAEGL